MLIQELKKCAFYSDGDEISRQTPPQAEFELFKGSSHSQVGGVH